MGKRELLLVVGFLLAGAIVYQATAPPPAPGERSFSWTQVVEHFRKYFGPTQKAFESLDANGQNALRHDLEHLWTENNLATDGTTQVESEYLEVRAVRA